MIKIAHRGNTNGPSHKENQPLYLMNAIEAGYDVELDLWMVSDRLWLGHDGPQYLVTESFLLEIGYAAWIHCKNIEALHFLATTFPQLRYFWHQEDDFTLTSDGYIWTYPGRSITDKSIIVSLGSDLPKGNPYGICSDYVVDLAGIEPASSESSIVLLQA